MKGEAIHPTATISAVLSLRPPLLALGAVALAVAAGCGGGDDEPAPDGGALTKAEYQKQGNALCKEAVAEVGRVPTPRAPDQIADYLERTFAVAEETNGKFESLEPPKELREDHEQAVRLSEDFEGVSDQLVERVRQADDPRAAIQREFRKLAGDPVFKRSQDVTRRLGLDECLEVGPSPTRPESS